MGITYADIQVKATRKSSEQVKVRFMIDSGAIYSLVPTKILKELDCEPYRIIEFSLADGTLIERKVGDAFFDYDGNMGPAPVIFGEEGDEPLLGATTLEAMGLVLNPITRTLHPMRMLLAGFKKKRIIIK